MADRPRPPSPDRERPIVPHASVLRSIALARFLLSQSCTRSFEEIAIALPVYAEGDGVSARASVASVASVAFSRDLRLLKQVGFPIERIRDDDGASMRFGCDPARLFAPPVRFGHPVAAGPSRDEVVLPPGDRDVLLAFVDLVRAGGLLPGIRSNILRIVRTVLFDDPGLGGLPECPLPALATPVGFLDAVCALWPFLPRDQPIDLARITARTGISARSIGAVLSAVESITPAERERAGMNCRRSADSFQVDGPLLPRPIRLGLDDLFILETAHAAAPAVTGDPRVVRPTLQRLRERCIDTPG